MLWIRGKGSSFGQVAKAIRNGAFRTFLCRHTSQVSRPAFSLDDLRRRLLSAERVWPKIRFFSARRFR